MSNSAAAPPEAPDESSPLLPTPAAPATEKPKTPPPAKAAAAEWTAEGTPVGEVSVVGEPARRGPWGSGIFSCLGRNDEFYSSDLEVCILGSFLPCVLYGGNVERLRSEPRTFANHCLIYSGLYMLGNMWFGWNCLAPTFSYHSRTAIRQMFNLEGSCEALSRSCGCCGSVIEDTEQREKYEVLCDLATHYFCHPCALCQEGRELRRKLPHPGFNRRSVMVMIPPSEQSMARGA